MPIRERAVVFVLLAAVTVLAWAYTIHQAHLMQAMDAAMRRDMDMSMNAMKPSWTLVTAVLLFLMWAVMMAAMMLPGTSPMIQAFATINRRRRERTEPYVPTVLFVAGYLVVWSVFAALATALQWLLQTTGLVTTMMQSASSYFSAHCFSWPGFISSVLSSKGASLSAARPMRSSCPNGATELSARQSWGCGMGCSAWAVVRR